MSRHESLPIGNLSRNGSGSGRSGRAAMVLLMNESPLMIIAADSGEVYAVDPTGTRGNAVASQHPEWIVGTYTDRCGVGTIAGDLLVHAREWRRATA